MMKCPLGKIATPSGAYTTLSQCWKEDCGWWDKNKKQCSIVTFLEKKNNDTVE